MNKILIFLGIITLSSSLMGSETRVNTLGGVSNFLIDNSNVQLYPALINDYPNEITGEIKRPSLSCFIEAKNFGVFGIGLNTDTIPTIVNKAIQRADFAHFHNASPKLAIYYGKKMRDPITIGIKLGMSDSYYEKPTRLQQIGVWDGMFSLKLKPTKENSIEIAGGVERFGFESREIDIDTVTYKDQGKYSYKVRVRAISQLFPKVLFIVGGNSEKIDVSWEKEDLDTSYEDLKSNSKEGYVGFNFTPVHNTTIILGTLISELKGDTIRTDTTFTSVNRVLPKVVIGIETKITNWLTMRIGGNKSFNRFESTKTSDNLEVDNKRIREEIFNLSFGWSIKFRDFELDVMSNELPFVKPSISLSATYKFSSF